MSEHICDWGLRLVSAGGNGEVLKDALPY